MSHEQIQTSRSHTDVCSHPQSQGYSITDVIKAARGLRAYLATDTLELGMPHLGGTPARLAAQIIGVKARKHEWTGKIVWKINGTLAWSDQRIRSAGIDPVTWRINDRRRAAFAWEQLRTGKRKYSRKRQEMLVSDLNNPVPDLDAKLIFSTQRDNLKNKEEKLADKNIKTQIINYLRDKNNI